MAATLSQTDVLDTDDRAETLDETHLLDDSQDIANFDEIPDVYDATQLPEDADDSDIDDVTDLDDDDLDDIDQDDLEDDELADEVNGYEPEVETEDLGLPDTNADDIEGRQPPASTPRKSPADERVERDLDQGLEETFPASDPVSISPGAD